MPAKIMSPRSNDTRTLPPGTPLLVTAKYWGTNNNQFKASFDGYNDPSEPDVVSGAGVQTSNVAVGASKTDNVYAYLDNVEADRQANVTVTISSAYALRKEENNPEWHPNCPPAGMPRRFVITGNLTAGAIYAAVVVYAVPPLGGAEFVVDGVLVRPDAARGWAAGVATPNAPGTNYYARIIEFGANDVPVRWDSVFLH